MSQVTTEFITQRIWYAHLERIERQNLHNHHYSRPTSEMNADDLVFRNQGDGVMQVKIGWKAELSKRFLLPLPDMTDSLQGETTTLIKRINWDDSVIFCEKSKSERKVTPFELYAQAQAQLILNDYGNLLEVPKDWWQQLCVLYSQPEDTQPLLSTPVVICLCGSTRFTEAYRKANFDETLAGRIILSIGCNLKTDSDWLKDKSEAEMDAIKQRLDQLHFRKIDMADGILVINVDGYIGESTKREIAYAVRRGRSVRYLEPDKMPSIRAIFEKVRN